MSNSGPSKQEIEAIFHRLRSQAVNKSCFDCASKNPTWASVTYGVFICIDCSAVHRSLGVHLTFVRSTNLDTNWTWLQLRQMQLGGNANASQFFRQHNCNTTDAQQKYNSRAAQLYRDKLQIAAQNAMKTQGTKLHLDTKREKSESESNNQEKDFFAECANDNQEFFNLNYNNNNTEVNTNPSPELIEESIKPSSPVNLKKDVLPEGEPSVDLLNSVVTSAPKTTIGVRKIQPKKSGLGAKKGGLGATKVKTNFADIEQRANLADQQQKAVVPEKPLTAEEEAEAVTSVRLAYQDLSLKKTKEEEKLKAVDPLKAKQMERLGMGFNIKGGISHSVVTDMQTITQDSSMSKSAATTGKSSFELDSPTNSNEIFYDAHGPYYTKQDKELIMMGFETIDRIDLPHSNITTMFSAGNTSAKKTSSSINEQPGKMKKTKGGTEYRTYENDEARKKFGNAKCISSDQFFGNERPDDDRSANLARFQGSNSISSADFFNDGTSKSNKSSTYRGYSNVNFNAPDLDDVRESVRQGVTKVAGKLSSMASDVMTSIQDKYGY